MIVHFSGWQAPGQHCCHICRFSFLDEKSLWKHLFEHANVKLEMCHICRSSFKTLGELKMHVLTAHKGYMCTCCYKVFHTLEAFQYHAQVHVLEVRFWSLNLKRPVTTVLV